MGEGAHAVVGPAPGAAWDAEPPASRLGGVAVVTPACSGRTRRSSPRQPTRRSSADAVAVRSTQPEKTAPR